MTGLPRFVSYNEYKVILFALDPLIKYSGVWRSNTNDMVEPGQPLNINKLRKVYVVEEVIQLPY